MIRKHQSGFLRPLLLTAMGLIALLLSIAVLVSLLRIPLNIERYKPQLESALGSALGRRISIDGDIRVTTSLWPYFEIEGLRIANPAGFTEGDLASIQHARVTLGLLALLKGNVRIREFRVSGLDLNLERTAAGDANWVLEPTGTKTTTTTTIDEEQEEPPAAVDNASQPSARLAVDKLSLDGIRVSYRGMEQKPLTFIMEQAEGSAAAGDPMALSAHGTLFDEPFSLEVRASSLGDFLAMTRSELGLQLNIAGARLSFAGLSEALRGGRASSLHMVVEGDDLSSLDGLLRLDLPPIKNYRLQADLKATPGRLELSSLQARVNASVLTGSMLVDRTGKRPFATVELHAASIQLKDFDTGDWSPQRAAADSVADSSSEHSSPDEQPQSGTRAKMLSPEALQRADASLTVTVAEVLSGEDQLGSGELRLTLEDGRIKLAPLQLQLPKSSLLMQASLKPGKVASEAALRVLIKNFDIGILSRLSNPDSAIGGTLNVDLDVSAAASNINIMSGANGYFDVSGQVENFHSALVDLWAVNLLSAVVSSSGKDEDISEINCLVSRFRLTNGIMLAEQLVTDTSKVRICGEGEISFRERKFDLVVSPRAKRPEFFSLATPLAVKGEFDDFRIGTKAGVLSAGTTAVRFAASPITTPVKRLFKKELPEDGADICSLPIGPRQGELEPPPGC